MAFNGYLLQVGDFQITGGKLVQLGTYEVVRKVQDLDPYRDTSGVLHRNSLAHVPITVSFDLMPGMTNTEMSAFLGGIQRNYTNVLERKVSATVYVPETDSYETQDMYLVEPELKIRSIDLRTNVIIYEALTIKFVGY